jgi:hypothetical protein
LALKNHDVIRPQILEEIARKSALKGMAAKRIAAPSPCQYLPTTFSYTLKDLWQRSIVDKKRPLSSGKKAGA